MRLTVIILSAFLLALPPSAASAYSCWSIAKPWEIMRDADAVFTGEVTAIDSIGVDTEELGTERLNVTFDTMNIWKGLEKNPVSVQVDTESLYEYDFEIGKRYLVYAYQLYGDRLTMVGCPRVKEINDATYDISKFGQPRNKILTGLNISVEAEEKEKTKEPMLSPSNIYIDYSNAFGEEDYVNNAQFDPQNDKPEGNINTPVPNVQKEIEEEVEEESSDEDKDEEFLPSDKNSTADKNAAIPESAPLEDLVAPEALELELPLPPPASE